MLRARPRARIWLPPVVGLGLIALIWQLVAIHNPYLLPRVPAVFDQLGARPGLYVRDAGATLEEVGVGAGVAFAGAFLLALAMSEIALVEHAVMPLAVALNVTPVVSIAPALTVMLGPTTAPRYVVTGIVVFFPVLVNSLVGLRAADPAVVDVARTLDASRREVLVHVRIPASLPYLFAAARICLPLAVVGAVVAEFTTAGPARGLGALILTAAQNDDLPTVFAAILVLAFVGVALTLAVTLVERRLLRWHTSGRRHSS